MLQPQKRSECVEEKQFTSIKSYRLQWDIRTSLSPLWHHNRWKCLTFPFSLKIQCRIITPTSDLLDMLEKFGSSHADAKTCTDSEIQQDSPPGAMQSMTSPPSITSDTGPAISPLDVVVTPRFQAGTLRRLQMSRTAESSSLWLPTRPTFW